MKVLLLAGGRGTRISEESGIRPKPMIEIGGKPILWHIMKSYSAHGFNDFVVLLGYKGYSFKEYFANYFLHNSDVSFDMAENKMEVLNSASVDPWKVTLVDTGLDTMTGGRIKKAQDHVGNHPFMLTYGDGVSDVDIGALVKSHKEHGRLATMTSILPSGRFGVVEIDDEKRVTSFREKPASFGNRINGGFFVCEPEVFDFIQDGDSTVFEQKPLEGLAKKGELCTYEHDGYWQCMDTLRDKTVLNELWDSGTAPWKVWN